MENIADVEFFSSTRGYTEVATIHSAPGCSARLTHIPPCYLKYLTGVYKGKENAMVLHENTNYGSFCT